VPFLLLLLTIEFGLQVVTVAVSITMGLFAATFVAHIIFKIVKYVRRGVHRVVVNLPKLDSFHGSKMASPPPPKQFKRPKVTTISNIARVLFSHSKHHHRSHDTHDV
jgi:hypothetical protein